MRSVILGMGVVGSILAAYLSSIGEEVCLVDISVDRQKNLLRHGIRIADGSRHISGGSFQAPVDRVYRSLQEIEGDVDVVFVCLKTCVLHRILPDLQRLPATTKIVSFQNGVGTRRFIAQGMDRSEEDVLRVVPNYAGGIQRDGRVQVTFFTGPNYISGTGSEELAQLLTRADLTTENVVDIQPHVWEKLLLNASMSPVCALTGLTMAEAMADDDAIELITRLLKEGIAVGRAEGVTFPDGSLARYLGYLKKAGPHRPSMWVDIDEGRETEIDFLNGAIWKYARRHGLAALQHGVITSLIRIKQQKGLKK